MKLGRLSLLTVLLIFNTSFVVHVSGDVRVESNIGTIIGSRVKVINTGNDVKIFKGIPYARPPIGELRFKKPEPTSKFESPFEALKFGNACIQPDYPGMPVYKSKSEDCLYLNVYVPDQTPDMESGHAVMVWIHGGGLTTGAGETYRVEKFCSLGNVIVVTINYRLGVFGFMDSQDGSIPGNLGLHDQHLAFKWVNENIGAFGGDNTRVTIFGQSAGGSSVFFQGMYPANEGLFQRVIVQSAVATAAAVIQPNPVGNILSVAKELGCNATSIDEAVPCIKSKDADTIMDTLAEMTKDPEKAMAVYFTPTVDDDIIKVTPSSVCGLSKTENLEQVKFFRSLDFISGFTNMEGGVFLLSQFLPIEDLETFNLSRTDFITKAIPVCFGMAGQTAEVVKSLLIAEYTDWSNPDLPENNRDQYVRLLSDSLMTVGSVEITRLHANVSGATQNTYAYVFSATSTNHALTTPTWLKGANHGDELGYQFLFEEEMLKELIIDREYKPVEDWEHELAKNMATYWANFAKSGNPNKPDEVPAQWPRYDMGDQQYVNFDRDMSADSTGKYLYAKEAYLWLETIPEVTKAVSESQDHYASSPFVKKDSEDGSCRAGETCDGD